MESPQNVPELRRFLGMINHQQKFIKNLLDKTSPLRDLLSSKNEWHWGPAQEATFRHLKNEMSQAPVLAHYCPEKDTIVSADASSYGLGAGLLQVQDDGSTKATAYASRSCTALLYEPLFSYCTMLGLLYQFLSTIHEDRTTINMAVHARVNIFYDIE